MKLYFSYIQCHLFVYHSPKPQPRPVGSPTPHCLRCVCVFHPFTTRHWQMQCTQIWWCSLLFHGGNDCCGERGLYFAVLPQAGVVLHSLSGETGHYLMMGELCCEVTLHVAGLRVSQRLVESLTFDIQSMFSRSITHKGVGDPARFSAGPVSESISSSPPDFLISQEVCVAATCWPTNKLAFSVLSSVRCFVASCNFVQHE